MFNDERWQENPIVTEEGISAIRKRIKETRIFVNSICANFFMQNSICDESEDKKIENIEILNILIRNASIVGCQNIILPLFERSEMVFERREAWERVTTILRELDMMDVNILFETDVPLRVVSEYLKESSFKNIGVCYDVGNSCGLGKDVLSESENYSTIIKEFHAKDKKCGGGTVMLGQGEVPYDRFVELLEHRYEGQLILESYYDIDAVSDTEKNLGFIKGLLNK